jgi:excisionase family DNA binding protein
MQMENEEVLTLLEAAALVKLNRTKLRRAIRRGLLAATNAGGRAGFRLLKSALFEWVRAGMPGIDPYTEEELEKFKDEEDEEAT